MSYKSKPIVRDKPKKEKYIGLCGECEHCTPYMAFHTLTVHGKKPTMGTCPYVLNRKVLLSEKGCQQWHNTKEVAVKSSLPISP